ncbi:MAG: tRNA (adenosine(37)-N6)-threonylcarbamoyltransferase complex dimerization subunit type 1 TsaB [Chitinophagaceae bacterium]|nr:tRNA (adenosine(37)-N6)-threonylcarbamoyltransferase complex dimerization subunit type 1 TsaB [Chitinophagaceae bacterium]
MLMNEDKILQIIQRQQQQDHSHNLHTDIAVLMKTCELDWSDLSAIAVMNGPGSYTGLRISLAAAKGICYAHQLPLILLHQFEILSLSVQAKNPDHDYVICQKARTDEYFVAAYSKAGVEIIAPCLMSVNELLEVMNTQKLALYSADLPAPDLPNIQHIEVSETHIHPLCFHHFSRKNFADIFISEPFYLKNVYVNKINKL